MGYFEKKKNTIPKHILISTLIRVLRKNKNSPRERVRERERERERESSHSFVWGKYGLNGKMKSQNIKKRKEV